MIDTSLEISKLNKNSYVLIQYNVAEIKEYSDVKHAVKSFKSNSTLCKKLIENNISFDVVSNFESGAPIVDITVYYDLELYTNNIFMISLPVGKNHSNIKNEQEFISKFEHKLELIEKLDEMHILYEIVGFNQRFHTQIELNVED